MSTTPLSFTKASYEGDPAPPDSCAYCQRELPGEYFRVDGHLACDPCARQAESLVPPDSHKAFTRSILFGIGAAIAGCIAYSMFEILSGIMLGWAAIGVGFVVGWAMRKGSRGLGGKRYQIAAALLTYAAVAMAAVPVMIHGMNEKKHEQTLVQSQGGASKAADAKAAEKKTPEKPLGLGGFVLGCLTLLGIGLISPFWLIASSFGMGLLNLFITFLGVQMAWKHMRSTPVAVEGPFTPSLL